MRIENVSEIDTPAKVIGELVLQTQGAQVSIPFTVPYDPGKIVENHSYSLRVRNEDGSGKLLFINDTSIPVITRGDPTQDIEVIVVPAVG